MGDPASVTVAAMTAAAALINTCETITTMIHQRELIIQELDGFRNRLQAFANLVKSLQKTIETRSRPEARDQDDVPKSFETMLDALTGAREFVRRVLGTFKRNFPTSQHGIAKYFGNRYKLQIISAWETDLSGWYENLSSNFEFIKVEAELKGIAERRVELPIDHIGLDETAILLTPNRNSSGPDEPLGSLVDVKYEKTQKMVEQWLEKAEEKALMRELDSALEFVMCAMRLIKEEGFGLDVLYKASRLLSFVYASQNEWKEAEQILDDLVDGDERARGRNAADTMYMLASNYFSNGNYEKATKWCWLALSWFKGTEKWNQQRIQLCYNLFAKINDIQGKSKEFNFWRSELDESFRKECLDVEKYLPISVNTDSKRIANIDQRGELLLQAAWEGCELRCRLLLEWRMTQNYINSTLLTSAQKGSKTLVEHLWKHGADVDTQDRDGATPLLVAILNRHHSIAEFLITKNANVNIPDVYGDFPLHVATKNRDVDIVEKLLETHADTEVKSKSGDTALIFAIEIGDKKLVQPLLKHGADIHAMRKNGESALAFSKRKGDKKVISLLRERIDETEE